MLPCLICGTLPIEGAHVRPAESFGATEDDRTGNIIELCPTHHTDFDNGLIGITPDKKGFLIKKGTAYIYTPARASIEHIRDEYISYRNDSCVFEVLFRLGLIPGAPYGKIHW